MGADVDGECLGLGEALAAVAAGVGSLPGMRSLVDVLVATVVEHLLAVGALVAEWAVGVDRLALHLREAGLLVLEHLVLGPVPLAAERTEVATSRGVELHVDVVVGLASEALGADGALEGFLASVDALVHDEGLLVGETLAAVVAGERLLPRVLRLVSSQLDVAAVVLPAEAASTIPDLHSLFKWPQEAPDFPDPDHRDGNQTRRQNGPSQPTRPVRTRCEQFGPLLLQTCRRRDSR